MRRWSRAAAVTGVVYDTKGNIVTNAHVVGSATALQVSPATGYKPAYPAAAPSPPCR